MKKDKVSREEELRVALSLARGNLPALNQEKRLERIAIHVERAIRVDSAAPDLLAERQQISAELGKMDWNGDPYCAERLLAEFIEKFHYSDAVARATGISRLDKACEKMAAEGRA